MRRKVRVYRESFGSLREKASRSSLCYPSVRRKDVKNPEETERFILLGPVGSDGKAGPPKKKGNPRSKPFLCTERTLEWGTSKHTIPWFHTEIPFEDANVTSCWFHHSHVVPRDPCLQPSTHVSFEDPTPPHSFFFPSWGRTLFHPSRPRCESEISRGGIFRKAKWDPRAGKGCA